MKYTVEQAIESIKREYNNALAPKVEEDAIIELLQSQSKEIEQLKGDDKQMNKLLDEVEEENTQLKKQLEEMEEQLKKATLCYCDHTANTIDGNNHCVKCGKPIFKQLLKD